MVGGLGAVGGASGCVWGAGGLEGGVGGVLREWDGKVEPGQCLRGLERLTHALHQVYCKVTQPRGEGGKGGMGGGYRR